MRGEFERGLWFSERIRRTAGLQSSQEENPMKVLPYLRKTIGLGSVLALGLGLLAGSAGASPDSPLQDRPSPANPATGKETRDASSGGGKMDCPACETVILRGSKHVGPPSKGHDVWFDASVRHTCSRCGMGSISVWRGRTIHSMTHACSLCGKEVAGCVAAAQAEAAKVFGTSPDRAEPKHEQSK